MTLTTRPLSDVLLAAATELSELSGEADGLGSVGLAEVERWQSLDKMSQHLNGLAMFFARLADNLPSFSAELSDALSVLTTTKLADRLAGRDDPDVDDAGALELFGA